MVTQLVTGRQLKWQPGRGSSHNHCLYWIQYVLRLIYICIHVLRFNFCVIIKFCSMDLLTSRIMCNMHFRIEFFSPQYFYFFMKKNQVAWMFLNLFLTLIFWLYLEMLLYISSLFRFNYNWFLFLPLSLSKFSYQGNDQEVCSLAIFILLKL